MRPQFLLIPVVAAAVLAAGCAQPASKQSQAAKSGTPSATPSTPAPVVAPSRAPTGASTGSAPAPRPRAGTPTRLAAVAVPEYCRLNAPATAIQASVDAGHQPWRTDPAQVVHACFAAALGKANWVVRQVGAHSFRVTESAAHIDARVVVSQPARSGRGGIWAITSIASRRPLGPPPACIENVEALQQAVAQGHQPWRADPVSVADVCLSAAYGWQLDPRHPAGTLVAPLTVDVVVAAKGQIAKVWLSRPKWHGRPGNIVVVTSVELYLGQD